ncbi:MAG: GAF domain-containing sensor histidine kinase [Actinobacteria bacterium]|nr:GAF domain-containing sensor histidine kinase [Actinomycetota bacterium]
MSTAWSGFRVRGAFATLAICVVLGFWWGWFGGFALAALAAVALVDATSRRRRGRESLAESVLIDMTLIGVAILLADLGPAGIGAAFVYMMAVPLLLLPLSRAVGVMAYGTVWTVLALSPISLFPIPPEVNRGVVAAIAYAIFTGLLLSLIAVLARSLRRSQKAAERRLKGEVAVAVAGRQLLSQGDDDALTKALEAIREATGADTAFVAENSSDWQTGPAAVVRQVSEDQDSISKSTLIRWTIPYLQHREPAAALAKGQAVRLDETLGIVLGRDPDTVFALAVPFSVGGEWAGFLGIAHDTSDGSTPDPDLHALETIAAMIGAFLEREQAYERLEQLVQSKDRFLASVSHEIRTPLTSVVGFASVLRNDPDRLFSEEGSELVELILRQSLEVSDMVEDLLVSARAEIDAVTVAKEPVNLGEEIESVLAARLATDEKDIFVAAGPTHRALADPIRVRQIIRNLVTNALRYGGDEITITTHRDGPDVTLVFSDNGEGIPNEYRQQIFEPYHRGESGTAQPQSIGLGLAVSRQLARLMDGDLTLRSDLGPATFQLTLPKAPKDSDVESPKPPDGAVMVGEEIR